jgi:HAMP domain-containing protein
MELLLNLAWLLLALPAYWLWRGARRRRLGRRLTSAQCLFALGCLLVILFPVISATDDLRAMRAEMEESPSSERSLRQASVHKLSALSGHSQPSMVSFGVPMPLTEVSWLQVPTVQLSPSAVPAIHRSSRAPPLL